MLSDHVRTLMSNIRLNYIHPASAASLPRGNVLNIDGTNTSTVSVH